MSSSSIVTHKKTNVELIDDSLEHLKLVADRASPLCPYVKGSVVFQKLDVPNTMGKDWVKKQYEEKMRGGLDEDKDIQKYVLSKTNVPKHSLKNKLRDHVADLFNGLSVVESSSREWASETKSNHNFDERMQKEIKMVEKGHKKRTNAYSKWAEQRAHAKVLGMTTR